MATPYLTLITGFGGGTFYEAPAGKMLGAVGGFTAVVLCEAFDDTFQQIPFANSDSATRGWQIIVNGLTVEARIFHDGPGSISVTHTMTAGDFGRLLYIALLFTGTDLALIINGSLVGITALPGGTTYLPATTQASLGSGAAGGIPFNGGIAGAAYSDQAYMTEAFRANWVSCLSSRDMVDGAFGSLLGPLVMPTFQHLYSARRGNNGGAGRVPVGPFPFLSASSVWPDERATGGAVNFQQPGQNPPFVITIRDGI